MKLNVKTLTEKRFLLYLCFVLCGFALGWEIVRSSEGTNESNSSNGTQAYKVSGSSMAPQLKPGDIVWMHTNVIAGDLKQGDIIAIQPLKRRIPLIKKIVAIPHDRFHLDQASGFIFVNGILVKNSVGIAYDFKGEKQKMFVYIESTFSGTIPDDSFLVFGDNPKGSLDSEIFGLVGQDEIIGYSN